MDIKKTKQAYRDMFSSPSGKIVLADLATFCHAEQPTYVPGDSHQSAYFEGMRRVYLRILKLTTKGEQ